jgi:hypothetical protein
LKKIGTHLRGHFVAYLALFFALGGTSFAAVNALPKNSVGSPQIKNGSIQKLDISKKTVSALRGLRGPRGLQGIQGIQGIQGVKGDTGGVGPTFGATAATGSGTTPAATIGSQLWQKDVTLPAAGDLFVLGHIKASLGCNASGSCAAQYGLYVDGTLVPGSGAQLSAPLSGSDSDRLFMFGVLPSVTAGTHTLKLGVTVSGNWSSQIWGDREIGAVLLGGTLP